MGVDSPIGDVEIPEIIENLIGIIDELAGDMRGQPRWQQAAPQQWGTELHNRLEGYINDADELLELLLSAGFKIYSENSLLSGEAIKCDDDGNIIWDDRGKKGTSGQMS